MTIDELPKGSYFQLKDKNSEFPNVFLKMQDTCIRVGYMYYGTFVVARMQPAELPNDLEAQEIELKLVEV